MYNLKMVGYGNIYYRIDGAEIDIRPFDIKDVNSSLLRKIISSNEGGVNLTFINVEKRYIDGNLNYICDSIPYNIKKRIEIANIEIPDFYTDYYDIEDMFLFDGVDIIKHIKEWFRILHAEKNFDETFFIEAKDNIEEVATGRGIRKIKKISTYTYNDLQTYSKNESKNLKERTFEIKAELNRFTKMYSTNVDKKSEFKDTSSDTVYEFDNAVNRSHNDILDALTLSDIVMAAKVRNITKTSPKFIDLMKIVPSQPINTTNYQVSIADKLGFASIYGGINKDIESSGDTDIVSVLVYNEENKDGPKDLSKYSIINIHRDGWISIPSSLNSVVIINNLVNNNEFLNITTNQYRKNIKGFIIYPKVSIDHNAFGHWIMNDRDISCFLHRKELDNPASDKGYTYFSYPGSKKKYSITFVINNTPDAKNIKITVLNSPDVETLNLFKRMIDIFVNLFLKAQQYIKKLYLDMGFDLNKITTTFVMEDYGKDIKRVTRETAEGSNSIKNIRNFFERDPSNPVLFVNKYTSDCQKIPSVYLDDDAAIKKAKEVELKIKAKKPGSNEYSRRILTFPPKIYKSIMDRDGTIYEVVENVAGENLKETQFSRLYFVCHLEDYPFPGLKTLKTTIDDSAANFGCIPCCYKLSKQLETIENLDGIMKPCEASDSKIASTHEHKSQHYLPEGSVGLVSPEIVQFLGGDQDNVRRLGVGSTDTIGNNPNIFIDAVIQALGYKHSKDIREQIKRLSNTKLACVSQEFETNDIQKIKDYVSDDDKYFEPSLFRPLLEYAFNCNIFVFGEHAKDTKGFVVGPSTKYGCLNYKTNKTERNVLILETDASFKQNRTHKYKHCSIITMGYNNSTPPSKLVDYSVMQNLRQHCNNIVTTCPYKLKDIVLPFSPNIIVGQVIDSIGKVRKLMIKTGSKTISITVSPLPPIYGVDIVDDKHTASSTLELNEVMNFIEEISGVFKFNRVNDSVMYDKTIALNYISDGDVHITVPIIPRPYNKNIQRSDFPLYASNEQSQLVKWSKSKTNDDMIYIFAKKRLSNAIRDSKDGTVCIDSFMTKNFDVDSEYRYDFDQNIQIYDEGQFGIREKLILRDIESLRAIRYMINHQYRVNRDHIMSLADMTIIPKSYNKISDFNRRPGEILIGGKEELERILNPKNSYYQSYKNLLQRDKNTTSTKSKLPRGIKGKRGIRNKRNNSVSKRSFNNTIAIDAQIPYDQEDNKDNTLSSVIRNGALITRDASHFDAVMRSSVWHTMGINRLSKRDAMIVQVNGNNASLIMSEVLDNIDGNKVKSVNVVGAGKFTIIEPKGVDIHPSIYVDGAGMWTTKDGKVCKATFNGGESHYSDEENTYNINCLGDMFIIHRSKYLSERIKKSTWSEIPTNGGFEMLPIDHILANISQTSINATDKVFESRFQLNMLSNSSVN